MLVICGDNIRMIMRKENHYICILLIGIIIRLGKDTGTNQLHLAKREIGIGRVLETGTTKKNPLCWRKFNPSPLLETLTKLLSEST